jgi:hypothetical protein
MKMKDQVIKQLNEAIQGLREQGQEPSQLMLDIQTLLNAPDEKPETKLVDLKDPQLEKSVQNLMSCGQREAQRYVNIVARAKALMDETSNATGS